MCPQPRSTPTSQTAVVRVTQGRTAIVPAAVISPHSLDADDNAFPDGKEYLPPFIMGKQLRDPTMDAYYQCHFRDARPERSSQNERGLSPPPSFPFCSLYAHILYHLNWPMASLILRSHTPATMSYYSDFSLRLFPNEHRHPSLWT